MNPLVGAVDEVYLYDDALSAEDTGLAIRTVATTDAAAQRQAWTVHEVDASDADQGTAV